MKRFIILLLTIFFATVLTLNAQTRPRLAILPFTGGNPQDGEFIARAFSYDPEINRNFTPVPRTTTIDNIMREQRFQRAGLTDENTIAELGRMVNADYVLSGHITELDHTKLLLITIIHVEQMQQIAGDYRQYLRLEDTINFLPEMAKRIAAASKQDTSHLRRLAVLPFNLQQSGGVNQGDAEILAQILATEIANTGKYAVFPRTKAIERVYAEHRIQRSGLTDPENRRRIGIATNAQYLLDVNFNSVGTDNYFSAAIVNIESAEQGVGRYKQYQRLSDGLIMMAQLARELTEIRLNRPVLENFVRITGGTFTMGSPANEPGRRNDETQRQVTVSSFYMSRHEVTQREWQEVMGTNPSRFKGDNLPVEGVSWYNAIEFCNRLSEWEGLTPAYTIDKNRSDPNNHPNNFGIRIIDDNVRWTVTWNRNANDGYRLPTEAEWEYACRAGTRTAYNTGNSISASLANFNKTIDRTTNVGNYAPNPWGLRDMHGNVEEWCWDWYGAYPSGAQTNPTGAFSGSYRVKRGGGWTFFLNSDIRSAGREGQIPGYGSYNVGFRLVRSYNLPPPVPPLP